MENKTLIITAFSIIGIVGYVAFHGHRLNQDCWMCKFRGITILGGSVGLGAFLALNE